jgi:hypothetical protein
MAEDPEKAQSESETHAPQEDTEANESSQPQDQIDIQREGSEAQQQAPEDSGLQTPQPDQRMPTEAERAADPDAPEGYEPQSDLQPGQTGGIEERPGEQISDVEAEESDQFESHAEENDDEAVDDSDSDTAE